MTTTLAIDMGGTNVKIRVSDGDEIRKIPSGPTTSSWEAGTHDGSPSSRRTPDSVTTTARSRVRSASGSRGRPRPSAGVARPGFAPQAPADSRA